MMSENLQHNVSQRTRNIVAAGIMIAVSTALMYFAFSVPIVPSFLQFDFSDLPALIASFALGPLYGIVVCFGKNVLHLMISQSNGVGELANFLLSAAFVAPAGFLYRKQKTRKFAMISSLVGAVCMTAGALVFNYYIIYPLYTLMMPISAILGMYKAINPKVTNLWQALLWFNVPFTFVKALISVVITVLIYKRISALIHGKRA